jgi:hypothetical protein
MVKRAARAAVIALVGMVAIHGRAEAAAAARPTVVLHVTDQVPVPTGLLRESQRAATKTYERIGVALEWTMGSAALAPRDGALHLDVLFLTCDAPAYRESEPTSFGKASHVTGRAYIFFGRILGHARATFSDPAQVLATVLAHELGHMLLPEYSHSRGGLMRAQWYGRILDVPNLTRAQAATIRSQLSADR